MPFASRLRLLQALTIAGLVDIALGFLLFMFAARGIPSGVIVFLLASGFLLAIGASIALSRLRCPRCGQAFCGHRTDDNQRSSIFTSRCMACGLRPEAPGAGPATGQAPPPTRMTAPTQPLPKEVITALQGGNAIEAIKLLRQWRRMGLKEAKDAIDQHLAGQGPAFPQPAGPVASATTLPPAANAALARGDKIAAIRMVRQQTGVDLKQAKELVDAVGHQRAWKPGDLAPGEVAKTGEGVWIAILLAAFVALVAYLVYG